MTSVPIPVLGPNGFIAPAEPDILAGVQFDMNAAFGGNLNPALTTPQGQIAVSWTAVIGHCNDLFLQYVNQVDPAYSDGRMQDAIARIYFLERTPAEPTVALCTCTGAAGVIIPTGALARADDGNTYICTGGGTIPIGGSIDLSFACTVTGPIACPIDNVNEIYQSVPGWDTITNAAEGVVGNDVESRTEFEARRSASVALNALGILPSIRASVLNVPDVLDAYVTENPTAGAVTIGGVSIAARSVYVAVTGGASADVAQAIWLKKPPGCGMVGSTTVTVTDANSGYSIPYPTYTIKFRIPDALPILFAVSLANGVGVPSDAVTQIKNAVLNAFYGADGGQRAKIGATVFASRFYGPIAALGSWASNIISVLVGTSTATLNDVTVNIDQQPTLDIADIDVTFV